MNKKLLIMIIAVFVSVPLYAVFANEKTERTTNFKEKVEAKKLSFEAKKEEIEKKRTELKERKEEFEQKRMEAREKKCETSNKRIQNRVKMMSNNLNMYNNVYSRTIERLERLSNKLAGRDLDVTDLNAMIVELETKIANLQDAYTLSIQATKESSTLACSESKDYFKEMFQTAKTNIEEIKSLRSEIKGYINNTIKPELQQLREQIEDSVMEDENKDEEKEEIEETDEDNEEKEEIEEIDEDEDEQQEKDEQEQEETEETTEDSNVQ